MEFQLNAVATNDVSSPSCTSVATSASSTVTDLDYITLNLHARTLLYGIQNIVYNNSTVKERRRPQNRKYTTYRNAVR